MDLSRAQNKHVRHSTAHHLRYEQQFLHEEIAPPNQDWDRNGNLVDVSTAWRPIQEICRACTHRGLQVSEEMILNFMLANPSHYHVWRTDGVVSSVAMTLTTAQRGHNERMTQASDSSNHNERLPPVDEQRNYNERITLQDTAEEGMHLNPGQVHTSLNTSIPIFHQTEEGRYELLKETPDLFVMDDAGEYKMIKEVLLVKTSNE